MGNKKTEVYEKIKKGIIDGTLPPGSPINENEYAQDLNVSKTPVREALRQLEREGLVENIPGRGSAVTHITFRDIREVFEIREIIECGAARRAASNCNTEEVRERKRELEQLSAQEVESKGILWGSEEEIHHFLIRCVGNQKLTEIYQGLLDHMKRIRIHFGRQFTRQRFDELLTEHTAILDAIIDGDGDRAEQAVLDHLHKAAAYLLGLTSQKMGGS
jgi:DNA-binding GntR family transcriptional regulator